MNSLCIAIAVSIPAGAILSYVYPFRNVSARLAASGAVVAGNRGARYLYDAGAAVVKDSDVFPTKMVAVISAKTTYYTPDVSAFQMNILIPVFILAVPIFDTIAVMVIRILNGKPVYVGDHNHISHRFVRMGLSRKTAVNLVHLAALAIGMGALPVYWGDFRTAAVVLLQAFLILGIITVLQFRLEERKDAVEKVEK